MSKNKHLPSVFGQLEKAANEDGHQESRTNLAIEGTLLTSTMNAM